MATILVGNRYKLGNKIGQGAFGKIYKGYDLLHNKHIAVKIQHKSQNNIIMNEIEIYKYLSKYNFNNIAKYHDSGIEGNFVYLIIDLLEQPIHSKTLERKDIYKIAIEILKILKNLHSAFILHRDIKPDNFLYDSCNSVRAIDFGLSKKFTLDKKKITGKNNIVGTSSYVSLNIHAGISSCMRDDVESLGYLICYLLNNNKLPWQKKYKSKKERNSMIEKQKQLLVKSDNIPKRIRLYFNHCRNLEYNEIPDYKYLINVLCG